jgi:hypothetical protein
VRYIVGFGVGVGIGLAIRTVFVQSRAGLIESVVRFLGTLGSGLTTIGQILFPGTFEPSLAN